MSAIVLPVAVLVVIAAESLVSGNFDTRVSIVTTFWSDKPDEVVGGTVGKIVGSTFRA